jgi:hypothetical protein
VVPDGNVGIRSCTAMNRATRPRISIIVPFKGDEAAARRLLDALEAVETTTGD